MYLGVVKIPPPKAITNSKKKKKVWLKKIFFIQFKHSNFVDSSWASQKNTKQNVKKKEKNTRIVFF